MMVDSSEKDPYSPYNYSKHFNFGVREHGRSATQGMICGVSNILEEDTKKNQPQGNASHSFQGTRAFHNGTFGVNRRWSDFQGGYHSVNSVSFGYNGTNRGRSGYQRHFQSGNEEIGVNFSASNNQEDQDCVFQHNSPGSFRGRGKLQRGVIRRYWERGGMYRGVFHGINRGHQTFDKYHSGRGWNNFRGRFTYINRGNSERANLMSTHNANGRRRIQLDNHSPNSLNESVKIPSLLPPTISCNPIIITKDEDDIRDELKNNIENYDKFKHLFERLEEDSYPVKLEAFINMTIPLAMKFMLTLKNSRKHRFKQSHDKTILKLWEEIVQGFPQPTLKEAIISSKIGIMNLIPRRKLHKFKHLETPRYTPSKRVMLNQEINWLTGKEAPFPGFDLRRVWSLTGTFIIHARQFQLKREKLMRAAQFFLKHPENTPDVELKQLS